MPTLAMNNFNISLSVLGGWVSLFGLVSYLCKEHFYLSEACECAQGAPWGCDKTHARVHGSCKALHARFRYCASEK